MIDCLYVGDSIAVGLQSLDKTCEIHGKVGASSGYITTHFTGNIKASTVIISMGTNDPSNQYLYHNVLAARIGFKDSKKVIWIVPYNQNAAKVVKEVAKSFNDDIIELQGFNRGKWGHPASYSPISKEVKQLKNKGP